MSTKIVFLILFVALLLILLQYASLGFSSSIDSIRPEVNIKFTICGDSNWMDDFHLFQSIVPFSDMKQIYLENLDDNKIDEPTVIINDINNYKHNDLFDIFETLSDGSLYIQRITNSSQISDWQRLYELVNLQLAGAKIASWPEIARKMENFKQYYVGNVFCWRCGCVAQKEYIRNHDSLTNAQHEIELQNKSIFYQMAIATSTDKVQRHKYHRLYSKHLPPFYYVNKGAMLEIGFGCNMKYGTKYAGSAHIWPKLFNNVNFIEYDGKCIEQYQSQIDQIGNISVFVGDQSDVKFLQNLIDKLTTTKNGFDIIIDDASHYNAHIILSFTVLWPQLNKNGIYIIEDYGESAYVHGNVDSEPVAIFGDEHPGTAQYFIKTLLSNIFCHITNKACYDLKFIECRQDICVLKKSGS